MFVDFLCTDVSSLFPHLVMFMPTKEIVSCLAISIVKFKFSWQEFSFSSILVLEKFRKKLFLCGGFGEYKNFHGEQIEWCSSVVSQNLRGRL